MAIAELGLVSSTVNFAKLTMNILAQSHEK